MMEIASSKCIQPSYRNWCFCVFAGLPAGNSGNLLSVATSPTSRSITKMSANSMPKLYCGWFCPFAQRAWIGLLHNGVEFEYIEQDPYNKSAEWLAVNPRGTVPVIVQDGKAVYESHVCLEFIDEMWPSGKKVMPKDPYTRAQARLWMETITKKMCTPFYRLLMKTGKDREDAGKDLLKSIEEFTEAMDPDGPFFFGKEFSSVDISWAPWALRDMVLKHYRDFQIPEGGIFARYHRWYAAVKEVPAVVGTLQPEDKLVQSYQRYADDSAKSLVADSIRKNQLI